MTKRLNDGWRQIGALASEVIDALIEAERFPGLEGYGFALPTAGSESAVSGTRGSAVKRANSPGPGVGEECYAIGLGMGAGQALSGARPVRLGGFNNRARDHDIAVNAHRQLVLTALPTEGASRRKALKRAIPRARVGSHIPLRLVWVNPHLRLPSHAGI